MTEKEKEILNALKVIQKVCEEHECGECPCCCSAECMIRKTFPDEWDLVGEQPIWKAFNY